MIFFCVKFEKDPLPCEVVLSRVDFFRMAAVAMERDKPIPIVLTYLVPLAVDVVPIQFHQFLFSE
jgi:hypothetical protein